MKKTVKEIKKVLESRAITLHGADIESLANSLEWLAEEFRTTSDEEIVDRYTHLIGEDLDGLVGQIVGVRKSRFTPDWLHYKDGVVLKAESKSCIYVEIDGETFKLNREDIVIRGKKKVKNRIQKMYSHIEVRTFDTSKTLHRVIAKDIYLPSGLTRAEAIRYAEARLLIDNIQLDDKSYTLY